VLLALPRQVSDGAAAVLLMSRSTAASLGLSPLATLRSYRVVGVAPDEMGVGPAAAIPAAVAAAGLRLDDVDVFELNEAFAAQAVYCAKKLRIPTEKLNPLGAPSEAQRLAAPLCKTTRTRPFFRRRRDCAGTPARLHRRADGGHARTRDATLEAPRRLRLDVHWHGDGRGRRLRGCVRAGAGAASS